jgi:hypothetical protein
MRLITTHEPVLIHRAVRDGAADGGRPFREAMADDFSWTIIGSTSWSRTYSGKQTVLDELLMPLFSQFADLYTNTASRFIAEGDQIVVECQCQEPSERESAETALPRSNRDRPSLFTFSSSTPAGMFSRCAMPSGIET